MKRKTVSFQISPEDYEKASKIAAIFYKDCFRGDRPMDIRELAMFALLAQLREMAWVIESPEPATNLLPFHPVR